VVDEIKGRVPEVYVALKPGVVASREVTDAVVSRLESMIGKIARPKTVHVVPDMPKTRSGKIMRRVLAAISNEMDTGDITTLANPDIVEQIRQAVQGKEKRDARGPGARKRLERPSRGSPGQGGRRDLQPRWNAVGTLIEASAPGAPVPRAFLISS
jgi:acetyl-CoA synthetase